MEAIKNPENKGITIITTHMNADFDAIASMLAAQKLYPGSLVIFPGSQEKSLRNFFIDSMVYLFNMADIKKIDFSNIKRLVLVDTRQPGRIGKLSSVLEHDDIDIHIYDHHPPAANDIKGHYEVYRQTGSTVTILTGILQEKGIKITPDEATIMCLGIYEDTGSFTFPSTTEDDFKAAAFLLSMGANLNVISNLISREINPKQISLLNDMIQASMKYNINGIEIVVTTISSDTYIHDFAFLVHKMARMENLDAIFAIAQMENKIYLVARSRISEVDVGTIVTPLGGGGHTFAASATIKGKTLAQIEQKLIEVLYDKIKARRMARQLMSSPPIMIGHDVSCKDASDILTRYNVNALLVTEKTDDKVNLIGYITRQVIEKALYHKLDHVHVGEYMTTEIESVGPDAELLEIQNKIIENKQRILPVIDKNTILGVVTRTDLLNILVRQSQQNYSELSDQPREQISARTRNIVKFIEERLSKHLIDLLRKIGKVANEIGCGAYVIGGFVRDLLLYRNNEDVDIVIEGDGIAFAKKYAQLVGARVHIYGKFGTAVVIFPDGFKIDVASARMEYYKFPAALPTVEMSSIKLDLFRRDFTINTLAIQLNPERFGTLIDFFAAQKDIKEKAIKVLHNLSLVEDPTRVFRAIRFEQRFEFTIGKLTSGLIENAVKMDFFKRLSGRRVFSELKQILGEENPTPSIVRLNDYGLLKVIHPSLTLNKDLISSLSSVKQVLSWHDLLFLDESYMKWAVYFMVLFRHCEVDVSKEICDQFEIVPKYQAIFCKERFEAERCLYRLEIDHRIKNVELYKELSAFRIELILYMMAVTKHERAKKAISFFITQLRQIKISISGKDLKEMRLEPGPIYRTILQAVLDAKLNGQLKTKTDELNFARDYASRS
ncbi:MAG: CBS domain-containing protein [Proteobacteria bacterium]|nr:CBS domain-containing protein [Pseudomonadota bacterium]